ncbi:LPXTG cell wall anchor domain-containing protein [Longispora fulva]
MASGLVVVPGLPAQAVVVSPLTLSYDKKIYGRFITNGNGVMQCPPAGTPQIGTTSCSGGAARTDANAVNDWFSMEYANSDSDPLTFNSSQAVIPIPPGSTIDYAKLGWAGDVGVVGANGGGVIAPACTANTPPSPLPRAVLPPGSPSTQQLQVTVGTGGPTTSVPPAVFVTEPTPGPGEPQYYSAQANITGLFAGVSGNTTVTVANVWTPTGFNCFGGWSLTVVYKFPVPDPTYAPELREIFIYDGHVRQGRNDAPTDTTITGFKNAGGMVRAGATAYEGDFGIVGDQFLINDQVMAEPATGKLDNFFISDAENASNPNNPNNYSVDAKSFQLPAGVVNAGDTSVKLTVKTSGDSYMTTQVVFSVPIAELRVLKEVCQSRVVAACTGPSGAGPWAPSVNLLPGDTAYWRITVKNMSAGNANNVVLNDPAEASCVTAAGTFMVPAMSNKVFYCSTANVQDTKPNTVTSRFPAPDDPPGVLRESPPSTATAYVARMTLNKEVCQSQTVADCQSPTGPWVKATNIPYNSSARWRITVTNTGGVALTNVAIADATEASCATTLDLAIGETKYVYCATANVTGDKTNTASAEFPAPPGSPPTTPSTKVPESSASVGTYQVVLVKEVCTSTTVADCQSPTGPWVKTTNGPVGSTAYWRLTLTHRGSVPVTGITVTDPGQTTCAPPGTVNLAVAETKYYYCNTTNVTADKTNTATASYIPPAAPQGTPPTTVTDSATYRVYGLTILKEVCTSTDPTDCGQGGSGPWAAAATGPVGSTAYWRITVANTGSLNLTGITLADPKESGCVTIAGSFDLAAHVTKIFSCSTGPVTDNITNTVTASFVPPGGTTTVTTPPSSATYTVYALTLEKEVCTSATAADCQSPGVGPWAKVTTVPVGTTAYWRITVTNTGKVTLTGITVADATEATCQTAATTAGAFSLAPAATKVLYCSTAALTGDKTNTATATFTPPGTETPQTATSSATAHTQGLTIVKKVCTGTGADCAGATGPWAPTATGPVGSTAYWQITVTNTGSVNLTGVQIADPLAPGCVKTLDVPTGTPQVFYCSSADVQHNLTNVAKATWTVDGRTSSTPDASATYKVYALTVLKEVCQSLTPANCGSGGTGPWGPSTTVPKGGTAYWRITVTNTGDETLTAITLTDSVEPACATAIGGPFTLAKAAVKQVYCSTSNVTADTANTVTGTFTPPDKPPVTVPPTTAEVKVFAMTLLKEVCTSADPANCGSGGIGPWAAAGTGPVGSTAYWRLTATNTGTVALTGITVADVAEPGCATAAGTFALAVAETKRFYCSTSAVTAKKTNTATATFTPPGVPGASPVTTPPTTATYDVFGLTVLKEVCLSAKASNCGTGGTGPWGPTTTVPVGDTAYWRITATNTGSVTLTAITLTDAGEASCGTAIGGPFDLAGGASKVFPCSTAKVGAKKTNTVTGTFTPPDKPPVTIPPTTATVETHGVTLLKEVCPTDDTCSASATGENGSTAHWRITVTNIGSVPLTGVTVADPAEPSCVATMDLAPGEVKYVKCSTANVTAKKVNTATATYTPPSCQKTEATCAAVTTPPSTATYDVPPVVPPVVPTPKPMPVTGSSVAPLFPLGGLLVAAGGLLLWLVRRRRSA